jgi:hypothetical protein
MKSLLSTINHRQRLFLLVIAISVLLLGVNVPPLWALASQYEHYRTINNQDYKARYGHWDVIDLPSDVRVNAIHAALLHTGKLLIVAGSGNDKQQFTAGTFKTLLWDPQTGQTKLIPTPTDVFCAGHAFLPDGKLLVAGGTLRYEVLEDKVTNAAGTIMVKNESPNGAPRSFPQGTEFVAPDGRKYRATRDFTLNPATKTVGRNRAVTVTAKPEAVFVEAEQAGPASVTTQPTQYTITGLQGDDQRDISGLGGPMTLHQQDYQGRKESYEFDPDTEQYVRVADMNYKRWYPTLTGLPDGQVLAISGLDGSGNVLDGENEIFDPVTKTWTNHPELRRYFPTYPAIFQTGQPNRLFFSGSNSGYGPGTQGRAPGLWNLNDNTFTEVPGLRDPDQLETSGSTWAGPVQDQTIMVVGGGGVGESTKSTNRIDRVDLKDPHPHFTPGPSLPEGTRYPNLVTLPDDTTLITGGSKYYRGNNDSNNHNARIYHPDTNTLTYAADPTVGRNYHSEALLMPDGRVVTLGSNSLYSDVQDTTDTSFEQRIEIYTPAYLFRGPRPTITDGPAAVPRGSSARFSTPDSATIKTARLIRASAVTHVTNVEQRSVALDLTKQAGAVTITVPAEPTIVPPGFYMLFVTTDDGTPSVARWVQVP